VASCDETVETCNARRANDAMVNIFKGTAAEVGREGSWALIWTVLGNVSQINDAL